MWLARSAVIACLVLASASVLHQERPQRVERVTELRFCPRDDGGFELQRVAEFRVDGKPAGQAQVETVLVWREVRPELLGP